MAVLAAVLFPSISRADTLRLDGEAARDDIVPREGQVTAQVGSGVPFVAFGEIGYGFTDWLAIGALAVTTPFDAGFGLRPKISLWRSDSARLAVGSPFLYYPEASGRPFNEPWVAMNPTVSFELTLGNGIRAFGRAGIVAAACVETLTGEEDGAQDEGEFMGGTWNTFGLGLAIPLGSVGTLIADGQAVMDGLTIADSPWLGGPPTIVTLGLARTF